MRVPKGWTKHPMEHAMAARGIKSKAVTIGARGMEDFSEKAIYHDEALIAQAQTVFAKEFKGYKLSKVDAKWFLSRLWKQYKEDYVVDNWESERDDAKESYKWELEDLREEAKMMDVPVSTLKQPFAEWFSDNYGYDPKLKAYVEENQNEYYKDLESNISEDIQEYFEVFKEVADGKTYRYVERMD